MNRMARPRVSNWPMHALRRLASVTTASVFLAASAQAVRAEDPKYTLDRTFGLSPYKENGYFVRSAFIPRTYLLYNIDPDEPDLYLRNYAAATTQDGVRVYISEDLISQGTFTENIGHHELVFHGPARVCRRPACDLAIEDDTWDLDGGEAFDLVEEQRFSSAQILEMEALRGNQKITAYISEDKLESYIRTGLVTKRDAVFPRYSVTKARATNLSTRCNTKIDKKKVVQKNLWTDFDEMVFSEFSLGHKTDEGDNFIVTFSQDKAYGDEGLVIQFYVYTIAPADLLDGSNVSDVGESWHIIAKVEYKCLPATIGEHLLWIRVVELAYLDGSKKTRRLYPWGTPEGLLDHTTSPYLWSVNSKSQFKHLLAKLSRELGDRWMAGYFISEFNRSCKRESRAAGYCKAHSYLTNQASGAAPANPTAQ